MADTPLQMADLVSIDWRSSSLEAIAIGYVEASEEQLTTLVKQISIGCPKIKSIFVNNGEAYITEPVKGVR